LLGFLVLRFLSDSRRIREIFYSGKFEIVLGVRFGEECFRDVRVVLKWEEIFRRNF
jgi:hypothetical protein